MVSQKAWRPEAAARLFVTVILTLFCGMFLALLVETLFKTTWTEGARDLVEMILMTICFHVAILLWTWRFLRNEEISWREAFFARRRDWQCALLGLAAGALATKPLAWLEGFLTEAAEKLFGWHLAAQELVEKMGSPETTLAAKAFVGVTAIVVAPLAEEMLFRGTLYPTAKQVGFPRAALWGTSILFGLSHLNAMAFVPLTLFAAMLAGLYELTDNLMAPVMAHCALNAINFYWIMTVPAGPGAH